MADDDIVIIDLADGENPLATATRKTMAAASVVSSSSTDAYAHQYLSRLVDFKQMDIQSALDQMKTLLSTRPHVVYKKAYYRKQKKNHWARDDPAFAALEFAFITISCVVIAMSFSASITDGVAFFLYSVFFYWLGSGFLVATVGRYIANRHLTTTESNSNVRESVEWLYAFDIHCNAFFPVIVLLYGVQLFLLPIVLGNSLIALVMSNALYAAAFSWYWYITHLGYRTLPFLSQTEVFLFPISAIALVFVLNLIGYPFGMGWNASRFMAHLHFDD
jgi:hypothetical protein